MFPQEHGRGLPDIGMLACQDGGRQDALDAPAPHRAPVLRGAGRGCQPQRGAAVLLPCLLQQVWRLQGLSGNLHNLLHSGASLPHMCYFVPSPRHL